MKNIIQPVINPLIEKIVGFMTHHRSSIESYPVRVIITGIEHSGTTLLANIIKQVPSIASGFECGFLLAERPADFRKIDPWYEWMQEPDSDGHWGIANSDLERICDSTTWEEAYKNLIRYSPVFDQKSFQQVCDKTPRYLIHLDRVLDKIPRCIPCLVIEKEVENLWKSYKKRNVALNEFCGLVESYYMGLQTALKRHEKRIQIIKYEKLCTDLYNVLPSIFSVIKLDYKTEYAENYKKIIDNYYSKKNCSVEELSKNEVHHLKNLKKVIAR